MAIPNIFGYGQNFNFLPQFFGLNFTYHPWEFQDVKLPIFNFQQNNINTHADDVFVYNPNASLGNYDFLGLTLGATTPTLPTVTAPTSSITSPSSTKKTRKIRKKIKKQKPTTASNPTKVNTNNNYRQTHGSDFGNRMVASAQRYIGCNEADGSHMRFIPSGNPNEPWCADFVSYIARENGVNINYPSVQGLMNWGKRNGKFHKTPKVGDAIIFKGWDSKKGRYASHTGIVTKVENGRVYTIEGNTTNKVAERSYALNDSKITGYVTIA